MVSGAPLAQDNITDTHQSDFYQERLSFWEAKKALDANNLASFKNFVGQLQDYPLVGYLQYDYLRTRLANVPDKEIQDFLERYSDSPITVRLRAAWLYVLARNERWQTYLTTYQPYPGEQGVALQCYALQARLSTGNAASPAQDWLDEAEKLWLVGYSQPDECGPVFKTWRNSGRMTNELIWQRIRLAMANRQLSLAATLAKSLNAEDQQWVKRWQAMHNNPQDTLDAPGFTGDSELGREILRYGIKRLARTDAEAANDHWQRIKSEYPFSANDSASLEKEIAMSAVLEFLPEASDWLAAVHPDQVDERVRQWRVRAALAKQDWQTALQWIDALDASESEKEIWRYWRARALEQSEPITGDPAQSNAATPSPKAQAEQIYADLAAQRSYYGFLAADRLGKPYVIKNDPIVATPQEMAAVTSVPGNVRASELYQLGLITDAAREWDFTVARLEVRQQQVAALLAKRWGWYDRAILTTAKAKHMDDLALRFPVLFREQVLSQAQTQALDPAWIYGIMRQESAFSIDARSSAGALGLMQLMPDTGKRMGKLLAVPLRNTSDLLEPDKNIQLGSGYLRRVLDANDGNEVLATASYNAGPSRVKQWLPTNSSLPADIWVDNVPFSETRNYIQQVMTYTTIFTDRLGQEITSLGKRMPTIKPPEE
ncbi:MAG TPA: transglycosylase SLT domain-containing protein [Gammaproteobacteria bacterium]|nr:transglycosylase SLT domain-containing protein [Gammaproteobacteria bacterium]